MEQIDSKKKLIEKQIVEIMLDGLGRGELTEDQVKEIAESASSSLSKVNSQQELMSFLTQISEKWPMLNGIKVTEEAELDNAIEDEVHSGVLTLAKDGKIDKAIKLAKSATNN